MEVFFADTESSLKLNLEAKKVSQRHFVLPADCTDGLRLACYCRLLEQVSPRPPLNWRWRRRVNPALLKSVDAVSPILLSRKITEQLLSYHHPSMISHAMVVNHDKLLLRETRGAVNDWN